MLDPDPAGQWPACDPRFDSPRPSFPKRFATRTGERAERFVRSSYLGRRRRRRATSGQGALAHSTGWSSGSATIRLILDATPTKEPYVGVLVLALAALFLSIESVVNLLADRGARLRSENRERGPDSPPSSHRRPAIPRPGARGPPARARRRTCPGGSPPPSLGAWRGPVSSSSTHSATVGMPRWWARSTRVRTKEIGRPASGRGFCTKAPSILRQVDGGSRAGGGRRCGRRRNRRAPPRRRAPSSRPSRPRVASGSRTATVSVTSTMIRSATPRWAPSVLARVPSQSGVSSVSGERLIDSRSVGMRGEGARRRAPACGRPAAGEPGRSIVAG